MSEAPAFAGGFFVLPLHFVWKIFPNLEHFPRELGERLEIKIAWIKNYRMEKINNSLLQGIDTVIVRVKDIETSRKWYREKLGLSPLWDDPNMKLTVLQTNGTTSLTLWQTGEEISTNRETASYPIFKTPDASALKDQLQTRGVETGDVIEDEYVRYFFFYDPDGNILEACQVYN